jgi:hypothetical protein
MFLLLYQFSTFEKFTHARIVDVFREGGQQLIFKNEHKVFASPDDSSQIVQIVQPGDEAWGYSEATNGFRLCELRSGRRGWVKVDSE